MLNRRNNRYIRAAYLCAILFLISSLTPSLHPMMEQAFAIAQNAMETALQVSRVATLVMAGYIASQQNKDHSAFHKTLNDSLKAPTNTVISPSIPASAISRASTIITNAHSEAAPLSTTIPVIQKTVSEAVPETSIRSIAVHKVIDQCMDDIKPRIQEICRAQKEKISISRVTNNYQVQNQNFNNALVARYRSDSNGSFISTPNSYHYQTSNGRFRTGITVKTPPFENQILSGVRARDQQHRQMWADQQYANGNLATTRAFIENGQQLASGDFIERLGALLRMSDFQLLDKDLNAVLTKAQCDLAFQYFHCDGGAYLDSLNCPDHTDIINRFSKNALRAIPGSISLQPQVCPIRECTCAIESKMFGIIKSRKSPDVFQPGIARLAHLWGRRKHLERIRNHPKNKELGTILNTLLAGDIEAARRLANRSKYTDIPAFFVQAEKTFLQRVHNQFNGVTDHVLFLQDPLYRILPATEQKAIVENTDNSNIYFYRAYLKNQLQIAWSIPDSASKHVHDALFKMIGDDKSVSFGSPQAFMIKIFDVMNDTSWSENQRLDIVKACCLPNGVLKNFTNTAYSSQLKLCVQMLAKENSDALQTLNQLIDAHNSQTKDEFKQIANLAIGYISAGIQSSDPFVKANYLAFAHDINIQLLKGKYSLVGWAPSLAHNYENETQLSVHRDLVNILAQIVEQCASKSRDSSTCDHQTAMFRDYALLALEKINALNHSGNVDQAKKEFKTLLAPVLQHAKDIPNPSVAQMIEGIINKYALEQDTLKNVKPCGASTETAIPDQNECQPTRIDNKSEVGRCPEVKSNIESKECAATNSSNNPANTNPPSCGYATQIAPIFTEEKEKIKVDLSPSADKKISWQDRKKNAALAKALVKDLKKRNPNFVSGPEFEKLLKRLIGQYNEKLKKECKEHKAFKIRDNTHLYIPNEFVGIVADTQEWEKLSRAYDNTQTSPLECGEPKPVWLDYEHIFSPVILIDCVEGKFGIAGFHADQYEKILKSGLIKFEEVRRGNDGTFEIEWSYENSKTKLSSFFPSNWTKVQVVEKIFEALKNIKVSVKKNNVRWELIGKTKEGLNIVITIDIGQSSAKIVSAYPFFEKKK